MKALILSLALVGTAAMAQEDLGHLIADCARGTVTSCQRLERERADQLDRIERELKRQREDAERRKQECILRDRVNWGRDC